MKFPVFSFRLFQVRKIMMKTNEKFNHKSSGNTYTSSVWFYLFFTCSIQWTPIQFKSICYLCLSHQSVFRSVHECVARITNTHIHTHRADGLEESEEKHNILLKYLFFFPQNWIAYAIVSIGTATVAECCFIHLKEGQPFIRYFRVFQVRKLL